VCRRTMGLSCGGTMASTLAALSGAIKKRLMTESTLKVAPTDRQARQMLLELVGSAWGDPSRPERVGIATS
jgi:hypothetical protein